MNEVERKNKEILKRIHNLRSSFSTPPPSLAVGVGGECHHSLNGLTLLTDDSNGQGEDRDMDEEGEEGDDDDSDTMLNGEYLLESSSGSGLLRVSPSSTTEPTEPTATDESAGDVPPIPFIFPEDRRYSDPPRFVSSSSGVVGGDVESTVSIKTLPFTPNANSRQDYQKFLRRFISTQVACPLLTPSCPPIS
jgi:hypothetical protein